MITAPNIGRAVAAALRLNGSGRVVAVFSLAIYIECSGELFALVPITQASGPLHARVSVLPLTQTGASVAIKESQLFIEGDHIWLSKDIWEPPSVADLDSAVKFLGEIFMHEPLVGLQESSPGSLEMVLKPFLLRNDLPGACALIFGRGIGLTPAGDDVCAGLLIAHHLRGSLDEAEHVKMAIEAPTHEISRAFLKWAAKGEGIEPLFLLLSACSNRTADLTQRYLKVLASIGHTSGLDLLYGLLIGLKYTQQTNRVAGSIRYFQ